MNWGGEQASQHQPVVQDGRTRAVKDSLNPSWSKVGCVHAYLHAPYTLPPPGRLLECAGRCGGDSEGEHGKGCACGTRPSDAERGRAERQSQRSNPNGIQLTTRARLCGI